MRTSIGYDRDPARRVHARSAHGVFAGGRTRVIAAIDDAFAVAREGGPRVVIEPQGARTRYTVDMQQVVGFVGGQPGALVGNPQAFHIRLVLEGTSVITAFPVIP